MSDWTAEDVTYGQRVTVTTVGGETVTGIVVDKRHEFDSDYVYGYVTLSLWDWDGIEDVGMHESHPVTIL